MRASAVGIREGDVVSSFRIALRFGSQLGKFIIVGKALLERDEFVTPYDEIVVMEEVVRPTLIQLGGIVQQLAHLLGAAASCRLRHVVV